MRELLAVISLIHIYFASPHCVLLGIRKLIFYKAKEARSLPSKRSKCL